LATSSSSPLTARFDKFVFELSSGRLFASGTRVPIQEQPVQILRLLLRAGGEVVTREQVRAALWPEDTYVDFEHGVNTAVKKLRQALEDSADRPRFIETLPRIGYRFMVPVEWLNPAPAEPRIEPHGIAIVPPHVALGEAPAARRQSPAASSRSWKNIVALAAVLIAGIATYSVRNQSHSPQQPTAVIPFTTFPGFEIAPSFSPDGNQIVFSWSAYEKEFEFDLFIKQVGQERVVQLTHHPAMFLVSSWSPDGRNIAFMRQSDPESSGVFLIAALGGAERKLADITTLQDWEPLGLSWSADGKWIAFAKANASENGATSTQHFSIHLVNTETTEERVLPDPSPECGNTWNPEFSPDGKYLASVCVLTQGVSKIYVQTADGREPREIVGAWSSEGFSGIAWAPGGEALFYSSDQHLWRVPLAGGTPERLLFAQDVESVSVSRNNQRLAFSQVRHPVAVWQMDLNGTERAAGSATKLLSSSRGDSSAHLSPDGKFIAFESLRSGNPELWICDPDGSNAVQLTNFGGPPVGSANWAPDSRHVVFDVRTSGNAELHTLDIKGGPSKKLDAGTPNASNPYWSSDGKWIYFSTERPNAIWKVPSAGGVPVRLTTSENQKYLPQESFDGSRVFYHQLRDGHAEAWSATATGGDERPVKGIPVDADWVAAQNGIYYIDGKPRKFSLNFLQTGAQKARTVADMPGVFAIGAATISRDGRKLLFAGIEHSEGDIMLVEGIR
jgi:Tol biopolymer transport system component/DNA-binding winged helix-turn-helix (wHTH) protein